MDKSAMTSYLSGMGDMGLSDFFDEFDLKPSQADAVAALDRFLHSKAPVFVLKGYAGTGKTFLLQGLANYLESTERAFTLMAPTGRAAKVIRERAGRGSTIHKVIYSDDQLKEYKVRDQDGSETFKYYFERRNNDDDDHTVYIVDEASMVSNVYSEGEFFRFGSGFLIKDLFDYVNQDCNDHHKQIIFVGDPAQLPPVNSRNSPALDAAALKRTFNVDPHERTLTDVVRQKAGSGILEHAVTLRMSIERQQFTKLEIKPNGVDIRETRADNLVDDYLASAGEPATDNSIIVCYTNARAKQLNDAVRDRIFPASMDPQPGDMMLVARNCYTRELHIYNGDFCRVVNTSADVESRNVTISKLVDGVRQNITLPLAFRRMQLRFFDSHSGMEHNISALACDNLIRSTQRDLSSDETKALYIDFKIRHPELKANTPAFRLALKDDEYFNCLRLKYGYAVTCHKAQGGEWSNAFVDFSTSMGYFTESYFRWAYTALTRAKETLYALNPPDFGALTPVRSVDRSIIQPRTDLLVVAAERTKDSESLGIDDKPLRLAVYHCVADRVEDLEGEIKGIGTHDWQEAYLFANAWEEARIAIYYNAQNVISRVVLQKGSGQGWAEDIHRALAELQGKTVVPTTSTRGTCNVQDDSSGDSPKFAHESNCRTPYQVEFVAELLPRIQGLGIERATFSEKSPFHLKADFHQNSLMAVVNYYFKQTGRFSRALPDGGHSTSDELLRTVAELTT